MRSGSHSAALAVVCYRLADRRMGEDGQSRRFHRPGSGAGQLFGHEGGTQPLGLDALDPFSIPRPQPAELHGSINGRATGALRAFGSAVRCTGRAS